MGITLVVNPGSTSRKYVVYEGAEQLLELAFEQASRGYEVCIRKDSATQTCSAITPEGFSCAVQYVAHEVGTLLSKRSTSLDVVGVRVVAPGTFFQQHQRIDDEFIRRLRKAELSAPLHLPVLINELEQLREYFPQVSLVAASDSAFHTSLPRVARRYSLPSELVETHDVYRFGYHGLSVASVMRRAPGVLKRAPGRTIVVHMGGGVSVTAIKDEQSIDTTMGFAPGSGLVMGSRAGDVDTGALLYLMRAERLDPLGAELLLQKRGGLHGLASESDLRKLLERHAGNDERATDALKSFIYHVQKTIGGYATILGGLDTLILTATAMERSAVLRNQLCAPLSYPLGITLGEQRNEAIVGRDGIISANGSAVTVAVIRTGEMFEIKRIAESFLSSSSM